MVDAVVSFVVERVGDYLIGEAVFLRGVKDEVESLKNKLVWMQCLLTEDAGEKQVDNPIYQKWVSDIREIAYDSEDVLEKILLEVDDGAILKKTSKFFSSIKKCSCISHKDSNRYGKRMEKTTLYSIGKKIEALRNRINDLSRQREMYGLENFSSKREAKGNALGELKQLRRAVSFVFGERVVGFEDDANRLLARLLDAEPQRFVISILGMGGLGKTTLARRLYHDVKDKFDRCAWICVSQDYNIQDLLLRIIKSFAFNIKAEELEKMDVEDMGRFLYKSLNGCSYLVVVDDVWKKEAWESLKKALPDNMNKSRVVITTRIGEVAESSDERIHCHKLRFLTPDESWKLFREKAFRYLNADEELEKLGREMVQKCGGLPLAIVVLAGLLSTKKPQEWDVVCSHIWRHLRDNSIHINNLLSLSFNDLPYHLKLCFLYLGLFPEDYEINVEELIRLFVAEGFIRQDEDLSMEDVARNYLDDLINRSLIQIEKRHWGRIATCRVHDLLRDLAIQKAKELNFLHIYDEVKQSSSSSFMVSCRRHAVYSWTEYSWTDNCLWLQHGNPLSRSIFFFNHQRNDFFNIDHHFMKPLCTRFGLLRVLNLKGFGGGSLPEEIGKLIHLKYFGLSEAFIMDFPRSIANLRSLQTLYIHSTEFSSYHLPTDIFNLKELKHLIRRFRGPLPIDNLTNLQTLKYVDYGIWAEVNTEKLVNLRELHMEPRSRRTEVKEFTFDSIAKLKSVQILSVETKKSSFSSLKPLSYCQYLRDLRLEGKIKKLPGEMHALLPKLQCLGLRVSGLETDPMPALEKLPKLTILDLYLQLYSGKKMSITAKGFPRLEILELCVDYDLELFHVEEGAFPMLKGWSLRIPNDSTFIIPENLKSVPLPGEWKCSQRDDLWLS